MNLHLGRCSQPVCARRPMHGTQPQQVPLYPTRPLRINRLQVAAQAGPVIDRETQAKAKKAAKAVGETLQTWGDQLGDAARKTWRKVDTEYQVQDKAQRLGRRLQEQWRDVDQEYGVRRKLRSAVEYTQRKWPVWRAQLDEFSATWYGKIVILAVIFVVISSPIFWNVLNFLLLLWWLAIPIGAALVQSAAQRAAEQAAAQQEAARRQQANPFAEMFRQAQQAQASRAGASSASGSTRSRGGYRSEGPVIDAEYVVLREDKDK